MRIKTSLVPVEAAFTNSNFERYHVPIRRVYIILCAEAPIIDKEIPLQGTIKAQNDSVGSDGLAPTLLVYETSPHRDSLTTRPLLGTHNRARAVPKASKGISRPFAMRQVRDAIRVCNGPDVPDFHLASLGSHVLIYRNYRDVWNGPLPLLDRTKETFTVLHNDGPKEFCPTVMKPY